VIAAAPNLLDDLTVHLYQECRPGRLGQQYHRKSSIGAQAYMATIVLVPARRTAVVLGHLLGM
jgi:hypothetical protein